MTIPRGQRRESSRQAPYPRPGAAWGRRPNPRATQRESYRLRAVDTGKARARVRRHAAVVRLVRVVAECDGLCLWWRWGLAKQNPFKFSQKYTEEWGVSREARRFALINLEANGLIKTEQLPGRAPLIRILLPEERAYAQEIIVSDGEEQDDDF